MTYIDTNCVDELNGKTAWFWWSLNPGFLKFARQSALTNSSTEQVTILWSRISPSPWIHVPSVTHAVPKNFSYYVCLPQHPAGISPEDYLNAPPRGVSGMYPGSSFESFSKISSEDCSRSFCSNFLKNSSGNSTFSYSKSASRSFFDYNLRIFCRYICRNFSRDSARCFSYDTPRNPSDISSRTIMEISLEIIQSSSSALIWRLRLSLGIYLLQSSTRVAFQKFFWNSVGSFSGNLYRSLFYFYFFQVFFKEFDCKSLEKVLQNNL